MEKSKKNRSFSLPLPGQRIVKTGVAVFLTLLAYYLRGYRGADMPAEAAITAIICMQPYARDTRDYALNRFFGTFIGAAWGLGFLLLMLVVPALGDRPLLVYLRMAVGVMLTLYTCVLVHRPETSVQATIVFLCVVIAFPEIQSPLQQAAERFMGVLLGTVAAIAVNVFRLPRDKERHRVFFVKIADLVPDRLSQLPAAAKFRLNYLYDDGAKICLMSEHAPAFFTLTLSQTKLSVPFIVMDGAAIYDAGDNSYLQTETMLPREAARLRQHLDNQGIGYFLYTIHHNKVCIFRQGKLREQDRVVLERMKRSPYRNYLEEEIYKPEEIVCLKIIDTDEKIRALQEAMESFVEGRRLRMAARPQLGSPGISGLYFYADTATMPQAEERLMALLRKDDPALRPREVFLKAPYRSEQDTARLMHRLANLYEPLKILRLFPKLRARLLEEEET